ncbi:hypothetical protein [Streptomyces sp. NPDC046805]|uniref:hypothetical protein n=1 Tax=Streptomyces sp. NPDC046805 TaxID=3155134 RepID=UPI0033F903D0
MVGLPCRDAWERAMYESVPVRCPACRREHVYAAPEYPCACGAPVAPALDLRAAPVPVVHRAWDEDWVTVHCPSCDRRDEWPHPELGCPCGTVLRIPVSGAEEVVGPGPEAGSGAPSEPGRSSQSPSLPCQSPSDARHEPATEAGPAPEPVRPAFRPVAIRTAQDAVTAAALYLRWLGYRDIRRADQRPPSGIGLAARGLLAQVDPTVQPASLRDVECLWLTAMSDSADCVYFSLSGYADDARSRADALGVPLFVLDLTGTPQPVNRPADDLSAKGT